MKSTDHVLRRLRKDRPMIAITLRMPKDVIEDLKQVAPALGHSGYQPLIRAYVGQGLRKDLARFEGSDLEALVASLCRRGVDESIIRQAIKDMAG